MANITFTDSGVGVDLHFNLKAVDYGMNSIELPYNATAIRVDESKQNILIQILGEIISIDYEDVDTPTSTDAEDLKHQIESFFFKAGGLALEGIQYFEPNLQEQYAVNAEDYDAGWRKINGVWTAARPAAPAIIQQLDAGAVDPFNTLLFDNVFGNKYRFTREDGSQTPPGTNDTVIDHLTGRLYLKGDASYRDFATAAALNQATGFYLLTQQEYFSLSELLNNNITIMGVNFSTSTHQSWSCSNEPGDTTRSIILNNNSYPIVSTAKTNTRRTPIYVKIWDQVIA